MIHISNLLYIVHELGNLYLSSIVVLALLSKVKGLGVGSCSYKASLRGKS